MLLAYEEFDSTLGQMGPRNISKTKYVGGLFRLKAGDKLSVSTDYSLDFYMQTGLAFFGTYMIDG